MSVISFLQDTSRQWLLQQCECHSLFDASPHYRQGNKAGPLNRFAYGANTASCVTSQYQFLNDRII